MSAAAPLQTHVGKPQPLSRSPHAGLQLQRKCACGSPTSSLTGKCADCTSKKRLQTKLAIGASNDPLEHEADRVADQVVAAPANPAVSDAALRIQRFTGQPNSPAPTAAPASVNHALASPGRPLGPELRQDMEQRFGHDFSRVRVHSGAEAEQSTRDVNANAYTVGHDMVFAAQRFAPGTHEGQRLIAHELAHVVQQTGGDAVSSPFLQRQPAPQTRQGKILSLKEVSADPAREKARKKAGQTAAEVCRSISGGVGKENCAATLEAGLQVTIVAEKAGGAWLQIVVPEQIPGFGPKEPLYVIAAFVGELPADKATPAQGQEAGGLTVKAVPPPSQKTQFYDFDIGPTDPANPNLTQLTAKPVSERADYIDARMTYMVYGIYLGGFQLYVDGLDTPIFISNAYLEDRAQSVSIGDRIYDSVGEAKDAVAAYPRAGDNTPRHAYYWGAGGLVIAPTVFSVATTPRIMATLFEARAELARQVQRDLAVVAGMMVAGKILKVLYGRARKSFTGDPPPKQPQSTPPPAPAKQPQPAAAPPPKQPQSTPPPTSQKPQGSSNVEPDPAAAPKRANAPEADAPPQPGRLPKQQGQEPQPAQANEPAKSARPTQAAGPVRVLPSQMTKGMEVDPTKHQVFRGGKDFTLKAGETKSEPSGLVKPTHGPSLDVDSAVVQKFGGAYQIKSIPPELKIIQRGNRMTHCEVVPRAPMTAEEFQRLLKQITFY